MFKENFYGNDGINGRNDVNAFNQFGTSPFTGPESSSTGEEIIETKKHLDIKDSNPRLDKYLFYFSSKL